MLAQLPILQVVLPLMAAPLCLVVGHVRLVWLFSCIVALASFAISVALLEQVMSGEVLSYALGGWPAPWGIEYRIDAANAFLLVLVSGMAAIVLLAAGRSVDSEMRLRWPVGSFTSC